MYRCHVSRNRENRMVSAITLGSNAADVRFFCQEHAEVTKDIVFHMNLSWQ